MLWPEFSMSFNKVALKTVSRIFINAVYFDV